jgi:hypothetical protein
VSEDEDFSARYRGHSLPGLSGEWTIDSVAYRSKNNPVTDVDRVTIFEWTEHLYVTARGKTGSERDKFQHFVLEDEAALREWLDK